MKQMPSKILANIRFPLIEAAVGGHWRLPDETAARERLRELRDSFTHARKSDADALTLWIRGYALTAEEKKQGYLGHYARITVKRAGNHKWTLAAVKEEVDLKRHPVRKYPTDQAHPNWGHPILRDVKKKRIYATAEEAARQLERLHEAYPEASLPGEHKLHLMVYGKGGEKEETSPVQKYIFKIRPLEEGGFLIESRRNERRKKPALVTGAANKTRKPKPEKGFFTSMVQKKKRSGFDGGGN